MKKHIVKLITAMFVVLAYILAYVRPVFKSPGIIRGQ